MTLRPVKGTRDLLNTEQEKFESIVSYFKNISLNYGFTQIETPIFEYASLFNRTLGEASDIVTKEQYVFTDKSGDLLTLRPEGTASIARAFISNSLERQLPLKWLYYGPMFRYERPQKGRYRQFHQLGIEYLGVDNEYADIEVLSLANECLKLFQKKSITLEINTIGDIQSRELFKQSFVTYLEKYIDELSSESKIRLKTNPLRILDSKQAEDQKIVENAPQIQSFLNTESKNNFDRILNLLSKININFTVNPRLVRGLDYYNHTVFEFVENENLGSQNAVLSGGRYDKLIEGLGGSSTPAVGWAAGIDRLSLLLEKQTEKLKSLYIIPVSKEMTEKAFCIAIDLRNSGLTCHMGYTGNLSKKLKKANNIAANYALIIGQDKDLNTTCEIKDLLTGEQTIVSEQKLSTYFKEKLTTKA